MADNIELSDDERLLDLLRLIVTRHPGTKAAITSAFKKSPHLANSYLTFQFREDGSMSEFGCRCHYDHEYMTYITDSGIDRECFSHVAKNVMTGHCRHAANNNDSPRSATCGSGSPKFNKYVKNFRRFSVDPDMIMTKLKRRLPKSPSSQSLRSLELDENYRGLTGLASRRSSSSLRSLAMETEEVKGQTQTSLINAAAAIGDGGLLLFLLKKAKTSLEQVGKFQLSPLHLAIIKGKMSYLSHIILRPEIYLANRAGMFRYASISTNNQYNRKSLSSCKSSIVGLCIKTDDLDTLNDLLEAGLISDVGIERGLKEAVEEDSADAVEMLLQFGARPDFDVVKEGTSKSAAVFESIFRPFRKDFKVFTIQHPEYIVRELLMPAILTKNRDVVQVLVQNGAPVSSCKGFYTPLTCAVLENQPDIVKLLLCYHAEKTPEMQGYNLLDLAQCMGFTECAEVLRNTGMKRKHRTIKSSVPSNLLLGIARKLDLPQDQVKLQHHLENRRHHGDEDTVLHVAIRTKLSRQLIRELLRLGSDVNARSKKMETPLMCAVSKETYADPEIIREILYFNPVLEQCDKSGKTTLMLAIARDQDQRNGNTTKQISVMNQSPDSIATLLLDCGYNVKFDDLKKTHHTMYALKAVWKDLAATIGCGRDGLYVQHNPKSLKVRSREVMRRSYPGIRLHKFLEFMKVPPEICDFVLLTQLLRAEPYEYET